MSSVASQLQRGSCSHRDTGMFSFRWRVCTCTVLMCKEARACADSRQRAAGRAALTAHTLDSSRGPKSLSASVTAYHYAEASTTCLPDVSRATVSYTAVNSIIQLLWPQEFLLVLSYMFLTTSRRNVGPTGDLAPAPAAPG